MRSGRCGERARTDRRPADSEPFRRGVSGRGSARWSERIAKGGFHHSDLFVESWGGGTHVVLSTARWLPAPRNGSRSARSSVRAFACWCLTAVAMGRAPVVQGEDFLRDTDDIAELMGDAAHLVGHSYGGLGVLFAAARRPDATVSPARARGIHWASTIQPRGQDGEIGIERRHGHNRPEVIPPADDSATGSAANA